MLCHAAAHLLSLTVCDNLLFFKLSDQVLSLLFMIQKTRIRRVLVENSKIIFASSCEKRVLVPKGINRPEL